MARQILPLAGQIVGGMIGGPVGAAIGGAIGSVVGNAIDPQIIKGPKLGDGQVQTSAEGVYRPIVLGTGAVKGNIIHRGPEVVRKHRESQGKGSGPKVETERRYRTFAIRVAEGPIAGILRIWMDEKLVYDIRPGSEIPAESEQFADGFRLYLGDEDQLPDPDIEAYLGIGNVNAYRGTAYIVFPNFDLTDYGDRIPQFRFEVISQPAVTPNVDTIAFMHTGGGSLQFQASEDGISWDASGWQFTGLFQSARNSVVTANRYITYSSSSQIFYSEDGSSWDTSGGGSSNTARLGDASREGVVIIPQALAEMRRSIDNAGTFSNIGGSPRAHACVNLGGVWIAGSQQPPTRRLYSSNNNGETWQAGAAVGLFEFNSRWASNGFAGFAGTVFDTPDYIPTFLITSTGASASFETLPFAPGPNVVSSSVPCLCFGNDVWVAVNLDGEIAYRDGSGWHLSGDTLGVTARGITFNGHVFILVGGVGTADGRHVIKTSEDGAAWTTRLDVVSGGVSIDSVASLKIPASEFGDLRLSDVVDWLSRRVDIGAARFHSEDLTDIVDGIVIAGDYTAADCIRTLMPVYMFDAGEHDDGNGYRINYVKRGGPVVATITANDLVDEPEESVREDALERPQKLHMHFQSPTVGYAPAKATSMRNSPDVLVTGEVSVSVPVVFSDVDEAWQRAGVMHQVAWSEVAGTQELVLSDAWLELVPTDTIGLVLRDQQRRLRITKIEHVEGTLKCEMMTDRQSSYTSNLTGVPLPDPTPPPPSIVGPTEFAFLDIPALTDSGDRLLYYVGVSGQSPAWHGAVIQRSMDGGANYEDVLTVRQNTIMGTLVDPVSDASEHYTDTTNVVRVQLFTDDDIQSLTQQQFLSEGGAFALEKPDGSWELMQYRDADDEGDDVFALTTLLRGRLNSETDEHLPGARFVLLEGVYAVDADVGMIGQDLTHRAVSLGTSPEVAPVSTDTYTAQSQTEWPVAHILSDGVDSGSLEVQIIPRHRFGTEDHPVRSINWQGFRITATDGSNTATVDTLSDTHTFSVGGWSDPITVTASQLNRFTGAGPSASEEFE